MTPPVKTSKMPRETGQPGSEGTMSHPDHSSSLSSHLAWSQQLTVLCQEVGPKRSTRIRSLGIANRVSRSVT